MQRDGLAPRLPQLLQPLTGLVHTRRTGALVLQALRNHPQEDAQHHVEHFPVYVFLIRDCRIYAAARIPSR